MSNQAHNYQGKVWTPEFTWLFVLSLSYLYCLPLLRTGVVAGVTASEIRIYDLVFVLMFLFLLMPRLSEVFQKLNSYSLAHRYLGFWLLLGIAGLIVTFFFSQTTFIIGVVRYFRFFSFSLVFVLGFMFIRNRKQLLILFDALLVCIAIISVIGSLQALKIFPNLWPDYYKVYFAFDGGYLSTATLAPNHTHYSLIMTIGIVMIITRLSLSFKFSILNLFYVASLLPMLYSMIASRGRSGWLVLGIYFMVSLVLQRNIKSLVLGALLVVSVFIVLESNLKVGDGTVEDVLLYRSINTHKDLGRTAFDIFDEEEKSWIERIDDNRWFIYQRSIEHLLDNPQYLLMGAGFQNAGVAIGKVAIAAHNAYLNVIAEHGLIGFFVYMSFLYFLFTLAWSVRKRSNTRLSRVMATNWIALYAGLLAANFFGEIIYPGRALFTFLGTFFIVAVLFLHPAWRNTSKT